MSETPRADQLLEDLAEIMAWSEEQLSGRAAKRRTYGDRGGLIRKTPYGYPLRKGSDSDDDAWGAHAKTKADHHEKMAEYHDQIADAHAAMADHYSSGAKGAHRDADEEDDREMLQPMNESDDVNDAALAASLGPRSGSSSWSPPSSRTCAPCAPDE